MAAAAQTALSTDTYPEIWRKIPPEEKLELMARAQSRGVAATLALLAITATVAVGLKLPWLFWGAFLVIPIVFQFAAMKEWRTLKPRTMLEYLAARSASRRFAYVALSQDLTVLLLYKGTLERLPVDSGEQLEDLSVDGTHGHTTPVWVALFPDTLVVMSERRGGAQPELVHTLREKLQLTAEGFDESGESRRLMVEINDETKPTQRWSITSSYPAALLASGRLMSRAIQELQKPEEAHPPARPAPTRPALPRR
jgi:hypothetical protein